MNEKVIYIKDNEMEIETVNTSDDRKHCGQTCDFYKIGFNDNLIIRCSLIENTELKPVNEQYLTERTLDCIIAASLYKALYDQLKGFAGLIEAAKRGNHGKNG